MAQYKYDHWSWSKYVGSWRADVWESDVNTSENSSIVHVDFYIVATHGNARSDTYNNTTNTSATIYINGSKANYVTPAKFDIRYNSSKKVPNGTRINLLTASQKVYHNDDGSKTISVSCNHYCGNTTPSSVTVGGDFTLTKINRAKSSTISAQGGTINIGSTCDLYVNVNTCGLTKHNIYMDINSYGVSKIVENQWFSKNGSNTLTFTIPTTYKNAVAKQATTTMYITMYSYDSAGNYLGESKTTATVKNPDYSMSIDNIYLTNENTIDNGEYRVGYQYYIFASWSSTITPKKIRFDMSGANYASEEWDTSYNTTTWLTPVLTNPGTNNVKVTMTDTAGHTTSKQFSFTIKEAYHNLAIISVKDMNNKVCVKENYNAESTKFKIVAAWNNTNPITVLKYEISGANSFSKTIDNPSGKEYAWVSGDVYNEGSNTVKVTITDNTGASTSKSITVYTYKEGVTLSIGASYLDSVLSVNMINNKYYKDYSRLGVRAIVNHSAPLDSLTVSLNGKTHNFSAQSGFDKYAREFTYTDPDLVKSAGDNIVSFYVKDVNGNTARHEIAFTAYTRAVKPDVPIISFINTGIIHTLSEGEKVQFAGKSSNIKDYKIVMAKGTCNVSEAVKGYTDESYFNADNKQDFSKKLINNTMSLSHFVLKDYGVSHKNCHYKDKDSHGRSVFYFYPENYEDEYKYYIMQWISEVKPGETVFIYVYERVLNELNEYLYSSPVKMTELTKHDMFAICTIPPCIGTMVLTEKIRTEDYITIEYKNPLYFIDEGHKNPIHVIDICLIAKYQDKVILVDSSGKPYNSNYFRDGLHGRHKVYYSDRWWHEIASQYSIKENNHENFEMTFDISKYPTGTTIYIVGFYYSNYRKYPSVYSTSNILRFNTKPVSMELNFLAPTNNENCSLRNPEITVRATYTGKKEDDEDIYTAPDSYIYFSVPRKRHDRDFPCFTHKHRHEKNSCFATAGTTSGDSETYPETNDFEYFDLFDYLYGNNTRFKTDTVTNYEDVYVKDKLFLQCNNDRHIDLGVVRTDELIEKGYIDFKYKKTSGRFLELGENILKAYTCPYNVEYSNVLYDEIAGDWINGDIFVSKEIVPYCPYTTILRPESITNWNHTTSEILTVRIPYEMLTPNRSYVLKFKYYCSQGFYFDHKHYYDNNEKIPFDIFSHEKSRVCTSIFSVIFKDNMDKKGAVCPNTTTNKTIYSPCYRDVDTQTVYKDIHLYDQWLTHELTFTTTADIYNAEFMNKYIDITIKTRGVNVTKIKQLTLADSATPDDIMNEENVSDVDESIKNNLTSIKVLYTVFDDALDFIDPLSYGDQMYLRKYLQTINNVYGLNITPKWRSLSEDTSYLKARDYNDVVDYCINLFTALGNHNDKYNKNVNDLFGSLPRVKEGDRRGPEHLSSKYPIAGYFYEWGELILAIKNFMHLD